VHIKDIGFYLLQRDWHSASLFLLPIQWLADLHLMPENDLSPQHPGIVLIPHVVHSQPYSVPQLAFLAGVWSRARKGQGPDAFQGNMLGPDAQLSLQVRSSQANQGSNLSVLLPTGSVGWRMPCQTQQNDGDDQPSS
jgi:hypothetical protein